MVQRVVGIDLGASAVWVVAAEPSGERRWAVTGAEVFAAAELAEVAAWCSGATVAVDAPGGRSEGRHRADERVAAKFRPARCAEVALRLHGIAVPWISPGPDDPVPPWMQVGFDLWDALDGDPLEVFPFGAFTALLGHRPANKLTVPGRRQRLAALADHLDLPLTATAWGHDAIDAAVAAVVAAHHADGRAVRVACTDHDGSVMWQPGPLAGNRLGTSIV
jgi:hypothetical protein